MARLMGRKEMKDMRPDEVQDGDMFAIKVVAMAGFGGDWTAYIGPSDWPDLKVAEQGEKVLANAVKDLFYIMCQRYYRE